MRRWLKPFIILVALGSAVLVLELPCAGVNTTFTPGITTVCVLRGQRATSPESLVVQLHSAESPSDYVSVVTVNAAIRLHAYSNWQNSLEPDPRVIDRLTGQPALQLQVHTFDSNPGFASTASIVMKQGDRIIKPASVKNPPSVQSDKGGYQKIIVADFPYNSFDPHAWTQITFMRDGKSINYDVDFDGLD